MPANHENGRRDGEGRMRIRNDTATASADIHADDSLSQTSVEGKRIQEAEEREHES
jgi:hypothetical protein